MNVIEKVARDLSVFGGFNPDRKDSKGEPSWRLYIQEAMVAIRALKNPDPISVEHLASIPCGFRCEMEGGYDSAVEAWNDTIDEMLKFEIEDAP